MNGQKSEYVSFSKTFCESRLVKAAIFLIIILIVIITLLLLFREETDYFLFSMLAFSVASAIFLSIAVYCSIYTFFGSQNRKMQITCCGQHEPNRVDASIAKVYYESTKDMNSSMQVNYNTGIACLAVIATVIGLSIAFGVGSIEEQRKKYKEKLEENIELFNQKLSSAIEKNDNKLTGIVDRYEHKVLDFENRVTRVESTPYNIFELHTRANKIDDILKRYQSITSMHEIREGILQGKNVDVELIFDAKRQEPHILDIFLLQAYLAYSRNKWDDAIFWWEQVEVRYPQKNTVLTYLAESLHNKALGEKSPLEKKEMLKKAYDKHIRSLEFYPSIKSLNAYEKTLKTIIDSWDEDENSKKEFIKNVHKTLQLFIDNGKSIIDNRKKNINDIYVSEVKKRARVLGIAVPSENEILENSIQDEELRTEISKIRRDWRMLTSALHEEFPEFCTKCKAIAAAYPVPPNIPETTNE